MSRTANTALATVIFRQRADGLEGAPEAVRRLARGTEGQALRLEVGILDGQLENAVVKRQIFCKVLGKFFQEPTIGRISEVAEMRP